MITGIHHIAMIVSSEESISFYRRLGFEEKYRKDRPYDCVVLMDGYGIELEVFIDSSHAVPSSEPIGIRHFALQVECIEDTLEELGIHDVRIQTDWIGRRYCNITNPDGLQMELHE